MDDGDKGHIFAGDNELVSKADKKQLLQYLKRREGYLDDCAKSIENWLEREKNEIQANRGDTSDAHEAIFWLDFPMAGTFHNCMLIAVCTFLEEAIGKIGNLTVEDYDSKIKQQKHGSWLKKHFKVYTSHTEADISPIKKQLRQFEEIITLRNAIAHAWGKVDACRNPAKLREIIAANPAWGAKTLDGYIHLEYAAYCDAIETAETIANYMLSKIPTLD